MLLRASGEFTDHPVDASAVTDAARAASSGIEHAEELIAFADAVVAGDDAAGMASARQAVLDKLGAEQLVDVAAVASNFQRMVRIADSTGIPLDAPMDILSADLQSELGLDEFGSAANTPSLSRARRAVGKLVRPVAVPLMRLFGRRMAGRNQSTGSGSIGSR